MEEDNKPLYNIGNKSILSPLIASIVEFSPIFSNDSKLLYTIWKNEIRSYSTLTGEFVQNFLGIEEPVGLMLDPQNDQMFLACSTQGRICRWIDEDSFNIKTQYLNIEEGWRIRWFDLYLDKKKDKVLAIIGYEEETSKGGTQTPLHLATCSLEDGQLIDKLTARASRSQNSISIGHNLVASVNEKTLYLNNILSKNRQSRVIVCEEDLSCVCVGGDGSYLNPSLVAVGNILGAIYLWTEPLLNQDIEPAEFHWHPLKVNCLRFYSHLSSTFFSGGNENVLVRWTVSRLKPKFLPRLPGQINHITFSNNNSLAALSLGDNSIQIIAMQDMKISAVIQHITIPKVNILDVDPKSQSLVLGGREGHIQLYNPQSNSILYHLDITMNNYVPGLGGQQLRMPQVKCLAFSRDGSWLVTCQQSPNIPMIEFHLKFWRIVGTNYSLTTLVDYPNEGGIDDIAFSPCNKMCVTCGGDKKFRVWYVTEDEQGWRDVHSEDFRGLDCVKANFCFDGSVLGVAFEGALTLWQCDEMKYRGILTPFRFKVKKGPKRLIRQVHFGNTEGRFHLIGTSYRQGLFVWNIKSLSLMWNLPFDIGCFFADHFTHYWSIFAGNTFFLFDPLKLKPDHKVKWTWSTQPVAATFGQNGNVFVLDDQFHLYQLKDEGESQAAVIPRRQVLYHEHIPQTAFSKLNAESMTSAVEQIPPHLQQQQHKPLGYAARTDAIIDQYLHAPSHSRLSSKDFLFALMKKKTETSVEEEEAMQVEETQAEEIQVSTSEDEGLQVDHDDDDEDDADEDAQAVKQAANIIDQKAIDAELERFSKSLDELVRLMNSRN